MGDELVIQSMFNKLYVIQNLKLGEDKHKLEKMEKIKQERREKRAEKEKREQEKLERENE